MTNTDQLAPLEVYVNFTTLSARQAAAMLMSLESIYQFLLPEGEQPYRFHRYDFIALEGAPLFYQYETGASILSVEQAFTGNSITFRFAGRKQNSGINWVGSDVEVVAPVWTATALAVGAVLLGSGHIYERYIETNLRRAQIEGQQATNKLIEAQINKTRAETDEIVARIRRDSVTPSRPARRQPVVRAIEEHVHNFYNVVNSPSITSVRINGIQVPDSPQAPDGVEP